MRIAIPVVCHNGHRATAYYRIEGLEAIYEGVPPPQDCPCGKLNFGEGWSADGEPKVEKS